MKQAILYLDHENVVPRESNVKDLNFWVTGLVAFVVAFNQHVTSYSLYMLQ